MSKRWRVLGTGLCGLVLLASTEASAHSVTTVNTSTTLSPTSEALLDPLTQPGPGGAGTPTLARIGDILTFVVQIRPVENRATRGAGAYITVYVPPNTRVVGARLTDANGASVPPQPGGLMEDGYGPGRRNDLLDSLGLSQGSLAQLYADTGIFFSTHSLTVRTPADAPLSVSNGLLLEPAPTGAGQIGDLVGSTPGIFYVHNEWDRIQALAFGTRGGSVGDGRGNTPFGFGSPVAGPETHYASEKVATPACSDGANNDFDGLTDYPEDPECASALDDDETSAADGPVGPWQRIAYGGSQLGVGVETDCASCTGSPVRPGVPYDFGWSLSPDTPLPSGTNAVRFALGELTASVARFAEISLRVDALPLDPGAGADLLCSEVFAGDASMPQNGQDNPWRYLVPSPSCMELGLLHELDVDEAAVLPLDTLTYTLRGKNLSTSAETTVIVSDSFDPAQLTFVSMVTGPTPVIASGTLTWPAMTLDPGEEYTFQWTMTAGNVSEPLDNRATYISDQHPAPGVVARALTHIEPLVLIEHALSVSPLTTSAGSVVRYEATLTNTGTGTATVDAASFVRLTLPAGFSFCGAPPCAPPTVNEVLVSNPAAGTGNSIVFTSDLQSVPPAGGALRVAFDMSIDGSILPGLYRLDLQTQLHDSGVGRDLETDTHGLAPLAVGAFRSEPPSLDEPVVAGDTSVSGLTDEGSGAAITIFLNGNRVAEAVSLGEGSFQAPVPTLFAGQHLSATAQNLLIGELVSTLSTPDVVVGPRSIPACGDVNADTLLDAADVLTLRAFLADPNGNPLSATGVMRCSVIGGPDDCDIADLIVLRRTLSLPPLPPGRSQVCRAVTP